MPATCGPFAWDVLHSVADAFHRSVCESCGPFAIAGIQALHDAVNAKLGKPLQTPDSLLFIAEALHNAIHKADLDCGVCKVTPASQVSAPVGQAISRAAMGAFVETVMGSLAAVLGFALGGTVVDAITKRRAGGLLIETARAHAEDHVLAGPDRYGSRCRDYLGRWVPLNECGADVDDERPVSDRTFALGQLTGTRYELRWRIVDVSELIPSHDPFTFAPNPGFPPDLQPRLRDRAATKLQVERIGQNIDADLLLTDFHTLDRGAPIIGDDLIVESGNGRTMALARAVQNGEPSYTAYLDELRRRAGQFGLSAADVKPGTMLVRERITKVNRRDFAQEANVSAAISTSAIENARTDAANITPAMIGSLQVLDSEAIETALRATRNNAFVARFLATLSEQEQAQLVDSDGRVNQEGTKRVTMALFVSAFPGDTGLRMAEKFFESVDGNVKNVFNGLLGSLGPVVRAESLVRAGDRDAGLAIGDDLAKAVVAFSDIKAQPGMTVENWINQGRLFDRELDDFQETVLRDVDERSRSGKKIGSLLQAYASAVINAPPPAQAGFFADAKLTKPELWDAAKRGAEAVAAQGQADPQKLIDWCNIGPDGSTRLWAWPPFRTSAALALGMGGEVEVCNIGLTGNEYQFTVSGANDKQRLERFVTATLGTFARQVSEHGTGRQVWEVVLPGPESDDLVLEPQFVEERKPSRKPDPQGVLFERAIGATLGAREVTADVIDLVGRVAESDDRVPARVIG